jgi:hypothetical protein
MTEPPFILWWRNLEILFAPLHRCSPFIRGLRCQAIQTEHGPYIAERTQKEVYVVRCRWPSHIFEFAEILANTVCADPALCGIAQVRYV